MITTRVDESAAPVTTQSAADGEAPQQTVAVIGGAVSGAEAAHMLASHGFQTVVFEQHALPYGKIKDGLPVWHDKLRAAEYHKIDAILSQAGIHYVPSTSVGKDVVLKELLQDWGFSAVLVATGAWKDRTLPIDGIDQYVGRGLLYQNPFISDFNERYERGDYLSGDPIPDGSIVVGGGLASIDVAKAIQFDLVLRALQARGLTADVVELETKGVPAVLAVRGLSWDELGIRGATLYYRRRVEDMPLTDDKPGATPEERQKSHKVREKLLHHAQTKYLFHFQGNRAPLRPIVEGGRLAGLVFSITEMQDGKLVTLPDTEEVRAPLVISSIGSLPIVLPGVPGDENAYAVDDMTTGAVTGMPNVFVLGNAVTGRGNIVVSRRHGRHVAEHAISVIRGRQVAAIAGEVRQSGAAGDGLLGKVRERQQAVGYAGDYQAWVQAHH